MEINAARIWTMPIPEGAQRSRLAGEPHERAMTPTVAGPRARLVTTTEMSTGRHRAAASRRHRRAGWAVSLMLMVGGLSVAMGLRTTPALASNSGVGYLPFSAGSSVQVTQANCVNGSSLAGGGPGTHCWAEFLAYDQYGWDFIDSWREGMPVVSATVGTVLDVRDGYVGSCASKCAVGDQTGNYVVVRNDADGTYSQYLHLQKGSVAVHPGQMIAVGQSLGAIGNTGNSYGAHLHYGWLSNASAGVGISLPGSFVDAGVPQPGVWLTSKNPGNSPQHLAVTSRGQSFIALFWSPPAQPRGAVTYSVRRDGSTLVSGFSQTTIVDGGLSPGSTHTYSVVATDSMGNVSAPATITANTDQVFAYFVGQAYSDVLQRPADTVGYQYFTNGLQNGMLRAVAARTILSSDEYCRNVVASDLFTRFLHRAPSSSDRQWIASALEAGNTYERMAALVLASPEYLATVGGTNTAFVDSVYWNVLNRGVDAAGEQSWVNGLNNGWVTRQQVAYGFLTSSEGFSVKVQGYYQHFLRRSADAQALNSWVPALVNGVRDEDVLAAIIGSDEYEAFAQSNHTALGGPQ